MLTPDLRSIFFKFDFSNDMTTELMNTQKKAQSTLDKVAKAYKLTFSDRDGLDVAFGAEATEAQYLGFIQGFCFAVQLITGKKVTI